MKRLGWFFCFVLIVVVGVLGYMSSGERLIDAAYCTLGLFFVNPISDSTNLMINISRWCSPILTASGILIIVRSFAKRLHDFFILCKKNTTVIYSKKESAKKLTSTVKNAVLSEDTKFLKAKDYIIMLDNDYENLKFCSDNKEKLADKRVFVELTEVDSFLIKDSSTVFFNINDIIARSFWEKDDIIKYFIKNHSDIKIAVIGDSHLTGAMLNQALLHNIYDINQTVKYFVYGSEILKKDYANLSLMNNDSIEFYNKSQESIAELNHMDLIVLCDDYDVNMMQYLLRNCNTSKLYFYCNSNIDLQRLYKNNNYYVFGSDAEVITEANIKTDTTYRKAKELNYAYELQYNKNILSGEDIKDKLWENLDGFTKGSNVAATDYDEIRINIEKELKPDERALAQMEHIRWSRYHFISGWKYGIPDNGKAKDSEKKIHNCLTKFEDLSADDQNKDTESINVLRSLR